MQANQILNEANDKMKKAVEFLQTEYNGLRSGKASPAMVDSITVDYYGTATRLRDMANISTPEPRLISIAAFDPSVLPAIEKAILEANIGVTPLNDGKVVRVPVPELSEERRAEIVKVAKKYAEDQRIAVRNIRREANDNAKASQKDGDLTEDQSKDVQGDIQKATDGFIKKIDELLGKKEKELTEV